MHMSRLETALDKGLDVANLKRESKLYSYDDQKWEAELQRERLARQQAARKNEDNDILSLMKQAKLSEKRQVKISNNGLKFSSQFMIFNCFNY